MSGEQGWRTDVDAQTYFGSQKKQLAVADRRPVPRNASDLGLGPGFASSAVLITDFNDILATYNGFFSSPVGAANAPNTTEAFVGSVTMDSTLGGVQSFTGMGLKGTTGRAGETYRRRFQRNPSDPESIIWGAWETSYRSPFARQTATATPFELAAAGSIGVPMPALTTTDPEVYERTSDNMGIRIKRPGVYSGEMIWYSIGSSPAKMTLYLPDNAGTRASERGTPSGVNVAPFHFRLTSPTGIFSASYSATGSGASVYGYAQELTFARHGDA